MHWTDEAIVLSVRKFGESSAIVHLLSAEHGLYAGMVKGAFGRSSRGLYQIGNKLQANWRARLSEQLGMFSAELLDPIGSYLLGDAMALAGLCAAAGLLEKTLNEREAQPHLYATFATLLNRMKNGEQWLSSYVLFECDLLQNLGFGFDLTECVATGSSKDLIYISPKSGGAVCREAGEQYKDRLYPLPAFFLGKGEADAQQIIDGMALTSYFLEKWFFLPHGWQIPAARTRLQERVEKTVYLLQLKSCNRYTERSD